MEKVVCGTGESVENLEVSCWTPDSAEKEELNNSWRKLYVSIHIHLDGSVLAGTEEIRKLKSALIVPGGDFYPNKQISM